MLASLQGMMLSLLASGEGSGLRMDVEKKTTTKKRLSRGLRREPNSIFVQSAFFVDGEMAFLVEGPARQMPKWRLNCRDKQKSSGAEGGVRRKKDG